MGQIRHGSATTTHAVRAAIQRSQASLAALSQELGINPKTVALAGEAIELGRTELVEFPGTQASGLEPCGTLLFADAKLAGDARGNSARKLVLKIEDVTKSAIEPV